MLKMFYDIKIIVPIGGPQMLKWTVIVINTQLRGWRRCRAVNETSKGYVLIKSQVEMESRHIVTLS